MQGMIELFTNHLSAGVTINKFPSYTFKAWTLSIIY